MPSLSAIYKTFCLIGKKNKQSKQYKQLNCLKKLKNIRSGDHSPAKPAVPMCKELVYITSQRNIFSLRRLMLKNRKEENLPSFFPFSFRSKRCTLLPSHQMIWQMLGSLNLLLRLCNYQIQQVTDWE